MSNYIQKTFMHKDIKGQPVMSLLIETALKSPSIYFQINEVQNEWILYWDLEILFTNISRIIRANAPKGMPLWDAMEYGPVIEACRRESVHGECRFSAAEKEMLQDFIEHSDLPQDVKKPIGLDGSTFIFKLYERNIEYRCWYAFPKEWESLKPIARILLEKAGYESKYRMY